MPSFDPSLLASNLLISADGAWTASRTSPVSYPGEGNDVYFAIEDSSYWFRHRNQCIVETVRRLPPTGPLCDIGGGNGFVARGLQDAGFDVVLIEPGLRGVQNARRRGVQHVVRASVEDLDIRPGAVGGAALFDVVEHLSDDVAFLRTVFDLLAPGGRVYVTVPAYSALWSHEDVYAGHFRRYHRAQLCGTLQAAGFQVDYSTYFFGFLVLPILLLRALPHRLGKAQAEAPQSSHGLPGGLPGRMLQTWMDRELAVIRRGGSCLYGGSCLAVGRKAAA